MKTVLEVARELARAHREEDPATTDVYLAPAENEVRLVEVSESVDSSGEKLLPFRFESRPDLGVPYDSIVVLLSPQEWEAVQSGRLRLPSGWGSHEGLQKIA